MPSERQDELVSRLRERAELAGLHGRDMDEDAMLDAANEIERLQGDLDKLNDPNAVHMNMLRGSIAKPSFEQIKHIYPTEFALALDEAKAERTEIAREIVVDQWATAVREFGPHGIDQCCEAIVARIDSTLTQETPNG